MENSSRNLAAASLLAQSRPSGTTAVTAFTAMLRTEITAIIVCNTSGAGRTFRIFHDDDGTTYDATTALYYDVALAAATTARIDAQSLFNGITVAKDGSIGVRSDAADGLTFTLYGVTEARY